MKQADEKGKRNFREAIIKMPDPPSILERTQAQLSAAGIPADLIKVTEVGPDEAGNTEIKMSIRQDMVEELARMLSIRLHTGEEADDLLPRITDVRPEEKASDLRAKDWVAGVRQKRAKPKKNAPPDRT
jgi:hypothetical protein